LSSRSHGELNKAWNEVNVNMLLLTAPDLIVLPFLEEGSRSISFDSHCIR
jgi:hypothetical protein